MHHLVLASCIKGADWLAGRMTDESSHPSGAAWRNFYGRRAGKTMNKVAYEHLENDLEAMSLGNVSWEDNPDRVPLDLEARFGGKPVWLEVGFGSGEHLAHIATNNPETAFIGCEPFINGVAALLGKLHRDKIDNVSIYANDARDLFDVLPEASLERAYLLYPDPWPKGRHHRRRFVTEDHLAPLARALKPGSLFFVATDIEDYVRQTMEEVPRFGFEWLAESASDWREPWEGWISTRYEQKALREGRVPHYMTFRRV